MSDFLWISLDFLLTYAVGSALDSQNLIAVEHVIIKAFGIGFEAVDGNKTGLADSKLLDSNL